MDHSPMIMIINEIYFATTIYIHLSQTLSFKQSMSHVFSSIDVIIIKTTISCYELCDIDSWFIFLDKQLKFQLFSQLITTTQEINIFDPGWDPV